jgi:uncharacterized delta-60 repeat protein
MNRHRMITLARLTGLVLTIGLLLALPGVASATDHWGKPDPTFGLSGQVFTDDIDSNQDVVVQPDGKVLVGGGDSSSGSAIVQRFLRNGAVDTTFGVGGTFTFRVGPTTTHDFFEQIALQPDGKIVAVGTSQLLGPEPDTRGLIARINPNGTLDTIADTTPTTAFGTSAGGYSVHQDDTTREAFTSVGLEPTGAILVGGHVKTATDWQPLVRKFTSDGSSQTLYDGNVAAELEGVDIPEAGTTQVLPASGSKLVVVFTSSDKSELTLLRFNAVGTIDESFGDSGRTVFSLDGGFVTASDIIATAGGKILVTGRFYVPAQSQTLGIALQYTASGETDTSFAVGGLSFIGGGGPGGAQFYSADDVAELPGGGFAILGVAIDGYQVATVSVITNSGRLNHDFGDSGRVELLPNGAGSSSAGGLAVQRDGRILAAGSATNYFGSSYFLTRLRASSSDPVIPDPAPIVPKSKIRIPSGKTLSASELKIAAGTATPAGRLSRVAIAVQRVDGKTLKRGKCRFLKNRKAKFKSVKARKGKCNSRIWLTATGTDSWEYTMKKRLPKGKYVLSVRATASDGTRQAIPTTKSFKVK